MSEAYVECLVKAKQSVLAKIGIALLIFITVILGLGGLFLLPIALVAALLTGFGAYLLSMFTSVEYEYLYLDKELTVDKVFGKKRRKRVAVYGLDKMEILAPINSYHLDDFKNRELKVKDYSVKEVLQPDLRYVMIYEGGEKILLNPVPEMVKLMRNVAPRKVFED